MAQIPQLSPWRRSRRPVVWVIVDALALFSLSFLVASAFAPVYGSAIVLLSLLGFSFIGMVIAFLAARYRWRIGTVTLVSVIAWFVFGSPLVMPTQATNYIIPSLRSLRGLATGPVKAWSNMLTLDPPIGETFNFLAVPAIIGLLSGLAGLSISLRSSRPVLAWIPPACGYLIAAALGARTSYYPTWVGLTFFTIVLVWVSYRRNVVENQLSESGRQFLVLRGAIAVMMLASAAVASLLLSPNFSDDDSRLTLRAGVEISTKKIDQSSPLQSFRSNFTKYRDKVLFEVRGAPSQSALRIAAMDSYDGISFRVATKQNSDSDAAFKRVGQWIVPDGSGQEYTLDIEVKNYRDIWLPSLGKPTSIHFQGDRSTALSDSLYYNQLTGTAITMAGLGEGDHYQLTTKVAVRPSKTEIEEARASKRQMPKLKDTPEQVRTLARQYVQGIQGDGKQALALEHQLRQGYFSHGTSGETPSAPGHSQFRLIQLLNGTAPMVGDSEQYAVAMTLMARELGMPARVVFGYKLGPSVAVTGKDAQAWTEIEFEKLGWVRFDPTPPEDRQLKKIDTPPPPKPRPYVVIPPPPPQKPENSLPAPEMMVERGELPEDSAPFDWGRAGVVALATGIPLLTIVVPITLIIGLKARRRVRRRKALDKANSVSGAWSELVDKARDLGRGPSLSATRTEQAEQLKEKFPAIDQRVNTLSLAQEADWLVFAPGEPSEKSVEEYWQDSKVAKKGMRKSVSLLRWLLSGLSTKSFRKSK